MDICWAVLALAAATLCWSAQGDRQGHAEYSGSSRRVTQRGRHLVQAGTIHAAYWGQGAASVTLGSICQNYNLILLSFLNEFGSGQNVTEGINIAGHSLEETAADISSCQAQGVPVLLSLGGGIGNYGLASTDDAQSTAEAIWDAYLGGQGDARPFGNVVLDGVDLDIEKPDGREFYAEFVRALSDAFRSSERKFYITAAPQCPYPDQNLGPLPGSALGDAGDLFDYVSIQFYNNPSCAGANTADGYSQWDTWASSLSKGPKLLPTFPVTADNAGSGFQNAEDVRATLQRLSRSATYGGFNVWKAEDDNTFTSQVLSS